MLPESVEASRVFRISGQASRPAFEQPGRGRLGRDELPRDTVTDRHSPAEADENQGEDGQPIQGRAQIPSHTNRAARAEAIAIREADAGRPVAPRDQPPMAPPAAPAIDPRFSPPVAHSTTPCPDHRGNDRTDDRHPAAIEDAPAMRPRAVPHETEDEGPLIYRNPRHQRRETHQNRRRLTRRLTCHAEHTTTSRGGRGGNPPRATMR